MVLGGELHRRQQRVLADRLRGNLVGGDAGVGVDALRRLRAHAAQPGRRAQRVDRGRVGRLVAEAADDVQLVAERLERLEDRRELEAGALGGRRPLVHDGAVRDVDEAEARHAAFAAVCASSVRAGIIESSSGSARVTPMPRRNVRRGRCFLVMNIVVSSCRLSCDPLSGC